MKIALVNDGFLIWRGGDHPIYEIATRLSKKHKVHVIAPEIDYPHTKFKTTKINCNRLVNNSWRDYLLFLNLLRFRREIRNLVKKEKYDIINVYHSGLSLAFLGIKNVIFTWQGSPPETMSEKGFRIIARFFLNRLNLILLNFYKKTIVVSEYLQNSIFRYVMKNKIVIIGEGVEKGFSFSKIDKKYILCQGRHVPHKRIDEAIRVSAELNYPLKIIGAGQLTKELKDLSGRLGAKVDFYSNISDKQKFKLFKECTIFISASRWEGFGLPFLEAQACGKPVVGYNLGSVSEVVLNNKTGFLVNNYEEFKYAASRLIYSKSLRKRMGLAAYNFSKKFSWDDIANKYEKLFYEIKNEKK